MKKTLIYLVLFLIIGIAIYAYIGKSKAETAEKAIANVNADYEKIEKVNKAMAKLSSSSAIRYFDNQAQWYIWDVRAIYQSDNGFYKELKKELGDDFDSQLSTGDYLFVGVLPTYNKYKVFAGDPQAENTMLYPDWKYTKLEKR